MLQQGRQCYLSGGHVAGVATIGHPQRYYRWEAVLQGEGADAARTNGGAANWS
jgi:hypothetical protein